MTSWLQKIFTPQNTSEDDDFDDESSRTGWGQNARIVLAILIVIFSAMVVWWLMS